MIHSSWPELHKLISEKQNNLKIKTLHVICASKFNWIIINILIFKKLPSHTGNKRVLHKLVILF